MKTYDVPHEMRDLASKSLEQSKKAVDGFFEAATKALDESQNPSQEMQDKAQLGLQNVMQLAEKNVQASLEYAQRLVLAKSLEEVAAIQSEFVRSQMQSFTKEAQGVSDALKRSTST